MAFETIMGCRKIVHLPTALLYHKNHLTRQDYNFDGFISILVFPFSKISPKTSLSKFPMFWRRHSIKKATILSVKVLAVIRFSSYRKDKCVLRYGKLIRKRRNSFECLAKVISLAKRRYTGTFHFDWLTIMQREIIIKTIFTKQRRSADGKYCSRFTRRRNLSGYRPWYI